MKEKTGQKNIIEVVLLVITIIVILFSYLNFSNLLLIKKPKSNEITYDRYPEFLWKGESDLYGFILSKNPDYTNPLINITLNFSYYHISEKLEFGDYYWKITDKKNSYEKSSKFTVQSLVAVKLDDKGTLQNAGNTKISSVESILATGAAILEINQELSGNIKNATFEQSE